MQLMRKELRNILWPGLLVGGLVMAVFAGRHYAQTASNAASSAEVIEQGRQIYADQCASCHGVDLHRFCSGHVLMLGGPLFEGHW